MILIFCSLCASNAFSTDCDDILKTFNKAGLVTVMLYKDTTLVFVDSILWNEFDKSAKIGFIECTKQVYKCETVFVLKCSQNDFVPVYDKDRIRYRKGEL